ncbi:MAG: hypothetical protein B6D56_02725 [Candidatus Omnitrophica bacterium 4484_70.1]|nr:MAG: hypothetical protein B6D56_02725 [Candidatus Omnitrophica bacterium 4484_70.1]
MSIIYEALKKVEKRKISPKGKGKWFFLLLFFFLFFLGILYGTRNKDKFYLKKSSSKKFSSPPEKEKKYILEGIVYDEKLPLAIINHKVLRKNDTIDEYKVTEITPSSVRLINLKEGKILSLLLE